MAGQYLPPPELAPETSAETSHADRLRIWLDLMRTAEAMLIAGFRHRHGAAADIPSLMRRWYREQMDFRDQERLPTHAKPRSS